MDHEGPLAVDCNEPPAEDRDGPLDVDRNGKLAVDPGGPPSTDCDGQPSVDHDRPLAVDHNRPLAVDHDESLTTASVTRQISFTHNSIWPCCAIRCACWGRVGGRAMGEGGGVTSADLEAFPLELHRALFDDGQHLRDADAAVLFVEPRREVVQHLRATTDGSARVPARPISEGAAPCPYRLAPCPIYTRPARI